MMNVQFKERLKWLEKYQVGDSYYYIYNNEIKSGRIVKVEFTARESLKDALITEFKLTISNGASQITISPTKLFNTKADLAEQFLKDNDIPSDLLKAILLPDELVFRQNNKDVATMTVSEKGTGEIDYLKEALTTPSYWDCECVGGYIHPAAHKWCPKCGVKREEQPDSRLSELAVKENMYEGD